MSEQGILNESAVPSGISDPAVNPAIDQPQVPATNVAVSSLPQLATRMGSSVGSVKPFDVSQPDNWARYLTHVDLHFRANGYSAYPLATQRDIFLSLAGDDVFDIVLSLTDPVPYETKTKAEIVELLSAYFTPRDMVLINTFRFGTRSQKPEETAAEYSTALRAMAKGCEYGQYLERALRDRFVIGLHNANVRESLFKRGRELTFQEAIAFATTSELASAHSRIVGGASTSAVVAHTSVPRPGRNASRGRTVSFAGKCPGCNGDHQRTQCPYRSAVCEYCKSSGHVAKVCRKKAASRSHSKSQSNRNSKNDANTNNVKSKPNNNHAGQKPQASTSAANVPVNRMMTFPIDDDDLFLNDIRIEVISAPAFLIVVSLNTVKVKMEVDSGSPISIISEQTFRLITRNSKKTLRPFNKVVRSAALEVMPVLGETSVSVRYNHKTVQSLPIVVMAGQSPNLLGRAWFPHLGIDLIGVHHSFISPSHIAKILDDFPEVFQNSLGKYVGPPMDLNFDPAIKPIRFRPRRVPIGIKDKMDAAIESLVAQDVLESVADTVWGTPVVPILKKDGSIRLCGDYKITINKAIRPHPHPVPVISHLLSTIGSASIFGRLDLAQAYLQCTVTDEVAKAQTIVTHRGAFKVKRLQFGISCAPGYFQALVENLLFGIPDIFIYFDDIVIAAKSRHDFEASLRMVLSRFKEAGLHLKREKCELGVSKIDFLGFVISEKGIQPSSTKFTAIQNYPEPRSKKELQQFLGLINFYSSFLKDKASVAEPLHRLLENSQQWNWSKKSSESFAETKKLLSSDALLVHFDPRKPIVLVCDASPYGVGAILCHRLSNGREAPVAYYSRTLSSAERNYAQIDKEALAIISGIKKFHNFLFGMKFEIQTDHKPLLGLFNPSRSTPEIISPRMLRWSLLLGAYDYTLVHRPGAKISHADALSRSPAREIAETLETKFLDVFLLGLEDRSPVTAEEIASATRSDPILSRVLDWSLRGWPNTGEDSSFAQYYTRSSTITVYRGCLLWGNRVIIPEKLRKRIVEALHVAHPGIVRMKALARTYVWWPSITKELESYVNNCQPCQRYASQPRGEEPITWGIPRSPWKRIHIDHAGPFLGKILFLVVDAYSGWLEVRVVPSTASLPAIKVLRSLFATHGIPEVIASDNGTGFTSEEFQSFCRANAIRQTLIAPFHPSSNGRAEQTVRSTKTTLKKLFDESPTSSVDWHVALNRFLIQQHVTPHSTDGDSPAELLMGRKLRTVLDAIRPDRLTRPHARVPNIASANKSATPSLVRNYSEGNAVFTRNFGQGPTWLPAVVTRRTGPVNYEVRSGDSLLHRHSDQLRPREPTDSQRQSDLSETLVCTSSRQSTEYENSSQSPAHISSVPTTLRPESRTVPQPHSGSPTASQPAPATCETPRNVCDRSDLPRLRPRPRRLLRFDSSSSSEGDHNDDPTFCPDSYESASD